MSIKGDAEKFDGIRVLKDKEGKVVVPTDDLNNYFAWEAKQHMKFGLMIAIIYVIILAGIVFWGWGS
jgi:hypothetical protein